MNPYTKYVFREHFASYKCAASNSLGRGSAEVVLTGGCRSNTASGAVLLFLQTFVVKLREREGQGVDLGRSLKGHL